MTIEMSSGYVVSSYDEQEDYDIEAIEAIEDAMCDAYFSGVCDCIITTPGDEYIPF